MLFHSLLAVVLFAFAGGARAKTPPNTDPQNNVDMIVAFGNLLAINGASITITGAKSPPVIGLSNAAPNSSFTIFMVDLDAAYLHWAQTGLSTSPTSMTIAGTTFYPLQNTRNVAALQPYVTPSPPAGPAHRYTQYLMSTTNNSDLVVSQTVATALQTRMNLNVSLLFQQSGKPLVASNWWNTSRTATGNATGGGMGQNGQNGTNGTGIQMTGVNGAESGRGDATRLLVGLGGLAALFSWL